MSRRVSAGSSNNPVFSGSRANTGAGGVNFANRGNTASNNANGNINANKGSNVNGNNNDNGNNRGTNSTNTNAKNDGNIIDNRLSAFPTGPRLQTPPSRRSSISSRGPIVLQPGLPPLFPAIAPTVSPTVSPPPRQVDLASPNLPYQPSAMGNHDRSPRGNPNRAQPLLMQDDWKRYPEKMVFIRGLAGSITIKDIFLTLRQFATIEMIELMLDGRGDKTGEAKLRCTTVLDPFWEKLIDFGNGPLRMRLGKLSMPAVIPSRVNPSKIFPEKFVSPCPTPTRRGIAHGCRNSKPILSSLGSFFNPRNSWQCTR